MKAKFKVSFSLIQGKEEVYGEIDVMAETREEAGERVRRMVHPDLHVFIINVSRVYGERVLALHL
jgi:hypothetical protein